MPTWPWKKPRSGVDEYGRSPLWHLAMQGDMKGVEKTLAKVTDPTAADKDGFSAVHVACEYGHGEVVRRLIEAGADVNCLDRHGNGPLWVASRCAGKKGYDTSIITDLVKAGADMYHINKAGRAAPGWAMTEQLQAIYKTLGYTGKFEM